jgi:NADH dehydrogenase
LGSDRITGRKRVFITGASSTLLQEVIQHIPTDGFEVVGLTRNAVPTKVSNTRWVLADLFEPEKYAHELNSADIIIHGAALTHSRNDSEYYRVNVEGFKTLLSQVEDKHRPLFVLISSRVAGPDSGAYGKSKLLAEKLLEETISNWLILRPAEVFGGSKNEGIDSTVHSAMSKRIQPCPIGLRSKLYPIHRSDAAKAVYKAIFEDNVRNQIIYINGSSGYSFLEIIRLVEKVVGRRVTIVPLPHYVLAAAAFISAITGLNFGFVPDQVSRLYSKKEHGPGAETTLALEEYIAKIATSKT